MQNQKPELWPHFNRKFRYHKIKGQEFKNIANIFLWQNIKLILNSLHRVIILYQCTFKITISIEHIL